MPTPNSIPPARSTRDASPASSGDPSTPATPDASRGSGPDTSSPAAATRDASQLATGDTSGDPGATDATAAIATEPDPDDQAEPADLSPEYVARLRREAAEHRRARRAAEAERDELRAYRLRIELDRHAAPRLADVEDLMTFRDPSELLDPEGRPDPARITAAVDALLAEKPYLAAQPRRRVGTGDGGSRGAAVEPRPASIGSLIRRAAGGGE